MKISFKFDWKIKISEKIKIYSFDQKNQNLMNDIFDELHRDNKLFWIIEFIFFSYFFFCVWKIISKNKKKKTNDREHSRLQCDNSIKCLFIIISIKYHSIDCFLLIHHDNQRDFFLLLMKSSFKRST